MKKVFFSLRGGVEEVSIIASVSLDGFGDRRECLGVRVGLVFEAALFGRDLIWLVYSRRELRTPAKLCLFMLVLYAHPWEMRQSCRLRVGSESCSMIT
jgi:hypothetical protein